MRFFLGGGRRGASALAMAAMMTGGTMLVGIPQAVAQNRVYSFSIARQPARTGLIHFARQAGIQVLATADDVRGRQAGPVIGQFDLQEGLRRLVASTGLTLVSFDGKTAVIASVRPAAGRGSPVNRSIDGSETQSGEDRSVDNGDGAKQGYDEVSGGTGQNEKTADILVIGTRQGAGDALDAATVKRRSLQSVSSLTAQDIEKIPDTTVGAVLRRMPGLQVNTSQGGAIIRVRGVTQVEMRVNGRNLTSTVGRGYDLAALPSDVISGVDVYKTPSASQLEGGIGGSIDLHTRRPFDHAGFAGQVSVRGVYGDLNKTTQAFAGGYLSDRWTTGIGDLGLLVGASLSQNGLGQHASSVPGYQPVAYNGTTLMVPQYQYQSYFKGMQRQKNLYASSQWQPSQSFLLTADLIYNRQELGLTTNSLYSYLFTGTPVSFTPYVGGNFARSGTWSNPTLYSITSRNDGYFDTYQGALNGTFTKDRLTVSGEVSYTNTIYHAVLTSPYLYTRSPTISLDTGPRFPGIRTTGIDLTNIASWRYAGIQQAQQRDASNETAVRGDVIYTFDGPIKAFKTGLRFDRRNVVSAGGNSFNNPLPVLPAVPYVGLTTDDFGTEQSQWLAPSAFQLQHYPESYRALLGAPAGPAPYMPLTSFSVTETIYNGYGELTFGFPLFGITLDGNFGLRYAKTEELVSGAQSTPGGATQPVRATQNYQDWLPSVNIRAQLLDNLYLRLAFAKQLSRPASFSYLSPSLSLDFQNLTGSAGNPSLRPVNSTQYDSSLEWYFNKSGYLYAAGFYKDLTGVLAIETRNETINGLTFRISRPYNLMPSWLAGGEVGYSQRFTFLPGILSHLGMNGSYTHISTNKTTNSNGVRSMLPGIAPDIYSVTGDYIGKRFYAGVTWSYFSGLVASPSADAAGNVLYTSPYRQLDASAAIAISGRLALTASAINLLHANSRSYLNDPRYFYSTSREDRRYLVGLLLKTGKAR